MATIPAIDLAKLLADIPRGAWVAISENEDRVISYGSEMHTVLEEAREQGEESPLVLRVPESSMALVL